jgi:hypothetical protein
MSFIVNMFPELFILLQHLSQKVRAILMRKGLFLIVKDSTTKP